jgi:uncharacterized repeat protein (TIGR01451 family)
MPCLAGNEAVRGIRGPTLDGVSIRRRLARTLVAAMIAGAALPAGTAFTVDPTDPASASPVPATAPAAAAPATPGGLTARYAGQGWGDLLQAGAAQLSCAGAAGCADPTQPAFYIDSDTDPSTVNSTRASLAVPPAATVDWAGLYWAGDLASRPGGAPPRCESPEPITAVAAPPRDPAKANQVRVAVNAGAYQALTAGSMSNVTGPGGGPGFQAYADITALVRTAPSPVTLTVADLQVAQGFGCAGGWTAVVAYSYPDGPDRTYAPDFRTIAVYDEVLSAPAGVVQSVGLAGFALPPAGTVQARVSSSVLASGQVVPAGGLSLDGVPVPLSGAGVSGIAGNPGPGYHRATTPVAFGALAPGVTSAAATVVSGRDGFVAVVLGVSTALPVPANLALTTSVDPRSVRVGDAANLTVTLRNDGTLADTGVVVTVHLPPGLTVLSAPAQYDIGSGQWTVGKLAAQGKTTLTLLVRATEPGNMDALAEITASDLPQADPDPAALSLVAQVAGSPVPADSAQPAAASGGWSFPSLPPGVFFGIGIFALGLLALSLVVIRIRSGV